MKKRSARLNRRGFVAATSFAVAGLCISGASTVRAAAEGPGAKFANDDLDAFVRANMEAAQVPGLSLAIVRHGKLLRTAGFGFADVAQRRPMQADTLINLGSVTKTITCTALMQLWERKRFALDDDVNAHLPFKVRNPAHPQVPVTFRQLLVHTSSINDGPAYEASYACGDSRVVLGDWLRDHLGAGGTGSDAQSNFHPWMPGAQYAYSNIAYGLLGHLVETLSGLSYADYVHKHVFAPLGMVQSRFLLAGLSRQSHATPYTHVADGKIDAVTLRDPQWVAPVAAQDGVQVPHCLYSFATPPDGAARSSARELVRFLLAYINGGELDGQRILRPETIALILSDQRVPFPAGEEAHTDLQGLTWYRPQSMGSGAWGHTGSDPGIRNIMVFRPQDRCGVVVLTNSDNGVVVRSAIARRIFAQADI